MPIPVDYRERVYAGVLGKIIGVYLGRPFENWTYDRILAELGSIEGYVNERFGAPLVVTDDDIAGTFTFLRALREHGVSPGLTAERIGRTWLNNIVENRSTLWWGGNGTSTEQTAWLNLKRGLAAPASGSAETNGQALAEQIGAQIFIDGWAMVAPGEPRLAARLAEQAARVSHDGEAVHAAMLIAAMEAEAFVADDMDHLIDTGLALLPAGSAIARLVADIRTWHAAHPDWRDTRALIERHYGYGLYPGICHVVPNHALVIMALLYAPDDFHRAMMIVNTAGWDTDCNAGNVGCLLGIKLGLEAFDNGPDWRGPVADRIFVSSADGGAAVTDAVRVSAEIVDLGHRLAGVAAPPAPKGGAPFHFSLPGSLQGFAPDAECADTLTVANHGGRLHLRLKGLPAGRQAAAMTPVFAPPESTTMRSYALMACPQVSPGQRIEADCVAAATNAAPLAVRLRLKVYGRDDRLDALDGPERILVPGEAATLHWTVPDTSGQPIQQVGVALGGVTGGDLDLDFLRWSGTPILRLRRPDVPGDFWRRAWVDAVTTFQGHVGDSFRISQSAGTGLILHGTHDWQDYELAAVLTLHLGDSGGLALRVQGLRRYYACLLGRDGVARLVKQWDDERRILAEAPVPWRLEHPYRLVMRAIGDRLTVERDGQRLFEAIDPHDPILQGGIGLLVENGALSTPEIEVRPPSSACEPRKDAGGS